MTCSAPKSVSILFAVGDDETRSAILVDHDQAVSAVVGWVERNALSRYRVNGEVAVVDAEGIIAATFRQHTSRALDPQLHTTSWSPTECCAPMGADLRSTPGV